MMPAFSSSVDLYVHSMTDVSSGCPAPELEESRRWIKSSFHQLMNDCVQRPRTVLGGRHEITSASVSFSYTTPSASMARLPQQQKRVFF